MGIAEGRDAGRWLWLGKAEGDLEGLGAWVVSGALAAGRRELRSNTDGGSACGGAHPCTVR